MRFLHLTASARKFQHRQSSAAQTVSPAVSSLLPATPPVTPSPSSAVGAFLGIPNVPRFLSGCNRLTKKGDFTEKKPSTMVSGDVVIDETVKLLKGDFSSLKSTNVRSIAKSIKKKKK